jgi:hypothetical protein
MPFGHYEDDTGYSEGRHQTAADKAFHTKWKGLLEARARVCEQVFDVMPDTNTDMERIKRQKEITPEARDQAIRDFSKLTSQLNGFDIPPGADNKNRLGQLALWAPDIQYWKLKSGFILANSKERQRGANGGVEHE